MGKLVLLASYPKSGNTWLRLVLDGLLNDKDQADINAIGIGHAANRARLDVALDVETSDMSLATIAALRPQAYAQLCSEAEGALFLKTHDALAAPSFGGPPPFSPADIQAVLYVVRDPRDVAVSFAHHIGASIDVAIEQMGDPKQTLAVSRDRLNDHVAQFIGDWSGHVESWLDADHVCLMRYEDMRRDPPAAFADACRFLALDVSPARLAQALEATAFDKMRQQEAGAGFRERLAQSSAPFFRRGEVGGWRDSLTPAQAARIVERHGPVMRRLGYRTDDGPQ